MLEGRREGSSFRAVTWGIGLLMVWSSEGMDPNCSCLDQQMRPQTTEENLETKTRRMRAGFRVKGSGFRKTSARAVETATLEIVRLTLTNDKITSLNSNPKLQKPNSQQTLKP